MADVDLPRLAAATAGLERLALSFNESQLASVPAAVVTADRRHSSPLRRAHLRVAAALDTPLLSWRGAIHVLHLSHEREVLEVSRTVVRAVTTA
jgi:hypothetical protein